MGEVEEYVTLDVLGNHNIKKPQAAAYAVSTLEYVSTSMSPVSDGVACNSGNGRETTQGAIGTVTIHLMLYDLQFNITAHQGTGAGIVNDSGLVYGDVCDVRQWTRRQHTQVNGMASVRWPGGGADPAEALAISDGEISGTISLLEVEVCS